MTRQSDNMDYCGSDPQVTRARKLGPVVLNSARAFTNYGARSKTSVLQIPGGIPILQASREQVPIMLNMFFKGVGN